MSHNNCNSYTHFTLEERIKIECYIDEGYGPSYIATKLGKHKSSVSREIARNSLPDKNTLTRVDKSAALQIDARYFRGTIMIDKLREKRNRYYKRMDKFIQHKLRYVAQKADQIAGVRRSKAGNSSHPLLLEETSTKSREVISGLIRLRWSPEQISIRLAILNALLLCIGLPPLLSQVSHETIYRFIYRHRELKNPYRHHRANNVYNATNHYY